MSLPWFRHLRNSRNERGARLLRAHYGFEGYGRYQALREIVAERDGKLDLTDALNRFDAAGQLGYTEDADLEAFLSFLSAPSCGLIAYNLGSVTILDISEDVERLEEKKVNNRVSYLNRQIQQAESQNSAKSQTTQLQAQLQSQVNSACKQALLVPDSACLPAALESIRNNLKKSPFPTAFSERDLLAFVATLTGEGLPPEYVSFCVERIAADSSVYSPAGLLKRALVNRDGIYDSWVTAFKSLPPPPEPPLPPPPPCPVCGEEVVKYPGAPTTRRRCMRCRSWFVWDGKGWIQETGQGSTQQVEEVKSPGEAETPASDLAHTQRGGNEGPHGQAPPGG